MVRHPLKFAAGVQQFGDAAVFAVRKLPLAQPQQVGLHAVLKLVHHVLVLVDPFNHLGVVLEEQPDRAQIVLPRDVRHLHDRLAGVLHGEAGGDEQALVQRDRRDLLVAVTRLVADKRARDLLQQSDQRDEEQRHRHVEDRMEIRDAALVDRGVPEGEAHKVLEGIAADDKDDGAQDVEAHMARAAVRFAFLEAPIDARIGVMQVPMFWPMMIGNAIE